MFQAHRDIAGMTRIVQVATAWAVVLLVLFRVCGAAAEATARSHGEQHEPVPCPSPAAAPGSVAQINPACDLRTLYTKAAQIGVGLAVLPDPTVARYRRIYDLSIQAIELGMLRDGYVLDRFYLPRIHSDHDKSSQRTSGDEPDATKQTVSTPQAATF